MSKPVNRYQYVQAVPNVLRLFAQDYKKDMTMKQDLELCDQAVTRIRELLAEEINEELETLRAELEKTQIAYVAAEAQVDSLLQDLADTMIRPRS